MTDKLTEEQRRMLCAVCADLSRQIIWHGMRLNRDDFRHLICGVILGQRPVTGISINGEAPGLIFLGGSSLKLTKQQASDAIAMAVQIGDHPNEQGLDCKPVRWSPAVLMGLGFSPNDLD